MSLILHDIIRLFENVSIFRRSHPLPEPYTVCGFTHMAPCRHLMSDVHISIYLRHPNTRQTLCHTARSEWLT